MTTAGAQPSAKGSRAASAWTRPRAVERASMPPDRSTAATSGHTCVISGVCRPVPEAISTARPGLPRRRQHHPDQLADHPAKLLRRLRRDGEATDAYRSALELEPAPASRSFIVRRLRELRSGGRGIAPPGHPT
jgi:hypothetical protein